jgi:hypothetical protein
LVVKGEKGKRDRHNVYEMYVRNGNKAGFWVVRDSWTDVVAVIRSVDRKQAGPLTGNPPYYDNPPVRAGLWDWKLKRWRQKYFDLSCPGTYAYSRIAPRETTPTDTGQPAAGDAQHPEGRNAVEEGSAATFAQVAPDGTLLPGLGSSSEGA